MGLDPDELRANLRQADPGVLVAVLAQLTGDPGGGRPLCRQDQLRARPAGAGRCDRSRDRRRSWSRRSSRRCSRPGRRRAYPPMTLTLFARIAPDGARGHRRRRVSSAAARTGRISSVAASVAAHRETSGRLPGRDHRRGHRRYDRRAGVVATRASNTRSSTATTRSAAPGTPPPTPASAWTPRRRTTRCRATSTAIGRATTRRAPSTRLIWCRWPTRTSCGSAPGSAPRWKRCGGTSNRNQWQIHAVGPDGTRDVSYANVVIPAAGYLNRPRWPDLPGRGTFAGRRDPFRAVGS